MSKKYILAIDQGTTSTRAIVFDKQGNIVATSQKEFTQFYPQPGWVEHNPMEIWGSQSGVMREVLETNYIRPEDICAIGITNQRETVSCGIKKQVFLFIMLSSGNADVPQISAKT